MSYFLLSDVKDVILQPLIDQAIKEEVTSEIQSLARSKGVSPDYIPDITPFEVKMVAIAYACYRVATYQAGSGSSNNFSGQDQGDIFEKKARMYYREYQDRASSLTKELLMGVADEAQEYVVSMEIFRS